MVSLCKSKTLFKHPMTEVLSRYPVKMKGLCRQMSSTSVIFNSRTSLFNQCINDLAIVFYFNFSLFQLIFPSQLEQSYTVQPWQRARYCMHGIQRLKPHRAHVCLPPPLLLHLVQRCNPNVHFSSFVQKKAPWLALGSGDNHGYGCWHDWLVLKADVSCKYEKGTCTKCTLDLRKDL